MIFQNTIVRFLAFFIPVKDMRENFIKKCSRKTKYRKLRDDLQAVKRELKALRGDIKGHIDLRLNSYFNTFFDYKDIKYNNPDLRIIQNARNIVLVKLKEICNENHIKYWLDFGTLVGAARHQGFVPWDDDIDIGMLREDYGRLEKIIGQYPMMNTRKTFFKNGTTFARVYQELNEFNIGFDIFIYDYINVENYENTISVLNESKNKLLKDLKSLSYNSGGSISFDFYLENKSTIDDIFDRYLTNCNVLRNNGSHVSNITNLWRPFYFYDKSSLFPLKNIIFEGTEHTVPSNLEEFLRVEFKNYMLLPNDTGKITHGSFFSNDKMSILKQFIDYNSKKDIGGG